MKNNLIEHLVRQAQNGNHEAFNRLVESFRDLAIYEALHWLGDHQSAEDAAQDAFLAAFTHLHQLRNPQKFGAWFRQIVRSQCNLKTRRKSLKTESLQDQSQLSAKIPTPEDIVERREHRQHVRDAVDNLPENERIVTEEYYLHGKKQSEIAEKLNIPVTTVKKRLQYARKKLKGLIHKMTISRPDIFLNKYHMQYLLGWRRRTWRLIKNYERYTAQLFYILFFTDYTNTVTDRQPDDLAGNRYLDL